MDERDIIARRRQEEEEHQKMLDLALKGIYPIDPSLGGKKEKDGKLFYELDWEFIRGMAQRMATNKGKYPPFNWHKPINTQDLEQANIRHMIEINLGNLDDEQKYGHYYALACNSMMILYQLRNYKNE